MTCCLQEINFKYKDMDISEVKGWSGNDRVISTRFILLPYTQKRRNMQAISVQESHAWENENRGESHERTHMVTETENALTETISRCNTAEERIPEARSIEIIQTVKQRGRKRKRSRKRRGRNGERKREGGRG